MALVVIEAGSRLGVHDAEGAEGLALGALEREAGYEAEVRAAGDGGAVPEARVLGGVGDDGGAGGAVEVAADVLEAVDLGLGEVERGRMVFANVPPTLSLVVTADMIIYLIVRADGPESCEMDTGILVAPGAMANPAFQPRMDMNMAAAMAIIAQDFHVDARVQLGLRSKFAARGRYSWQEGAQQAFNSWLAPRYQRAWAAMRAPAAAPAPLQRTAA